MRWSYIGCSTDKVPKALLANEKLSAEEIKSLLQDIPLIEGSLEAPNVDNLVHQLIEKHIYPLKIRPCGIVEYRLFKMQWMKHLAAQKKEETQKPKEKENRTFIPIIPPPMWPKVVFVLVVITLILGVVLCLIANSLK